MGVTAIAENHFRRWPRRRSTPSWPPPAPLGARSGTRA